MVNSDADATPQMTPPRDSAFRAEAWINSVELESKLDKCMTLIGNPNPHFESSEVLSKLYWPEDTHQNESIILDEVCKIAQIDPDASRHAPELLWYKSKGTSRYKIRNVPALQDAKHVKPSSRVLTIIVFRNLSPITVLSGKEFLDAWWQIAIASLWNRGVRHRGVSLGNLTVYRTRGRFVGVLNDYDLSWRKKDSPSGVKRTGAVPFMAIDLLVPEDTMGKVKRAYAHDVESFIWVLVWICLRYEDGKPLSKNRPLEEWLKLDAIECKNKKTYFWLVGFIYSRPSGSHEASWDLVKRCSAEAYSIYTPFGYRKLADHLAFNLLLEGPMQDGES
ncbi:uncharacterized protein EDB93DRAFT_1169954 [Suillus bovinus]|uniref:uncharacterized protein n=1 Tax=Suillus bovinus TaxID=48563 RepID=UPI001B883A9B|nr:uncharacterized protein EDB93DRAFT_1169954 [Suillus bovinus]KAG2136114.1 hypothetical protein EDB93DRAFT_1169954 [Suillus bovinus]